MYSLAVYNSFERCVFTSLALVRSFAVLHLIVLNYLYIVDSNLQSHELLSKIFCHPIDYLFTMWFPLLGELPFHQAVPPTLSVDRTAMILTGKPRWDSFHPFTS